MPSSTLHNKNPFENLFQQSPNYLKLKQLGCLCYPLTRPYNHNNLELKSKPYVFVGYSLSQSAYLCLDTKSTVFTILSTCYLVKDNFPSISPTSKPFLLDLHSSLPSSREHISCDNLTVCVVSLSPLHTAS